MIESILRSLLEIAPIHVPEFGIRFIANAFLPRCPPNLAQTVTQYSVDR